MASWTSHSFRVNFRLHLRSLSARPSDGKMYSQQKVAIITKVEFGALKVLDEDGTERIIREDTVLPGTPASNRGALDAFNNPVFDGSMVQIIKGEFQVSLTLVVASQSKD